MSAIDLRPFCGRSNDPRSFLRKPWTHKGHTYGCNGHILVRVPCPDQQDALAEHELADKAMALIQAADKAEYIPLPSFPHPKVCLGCEGEGAYPQFKCEDCEGEGEFDHGQYTYTCKECDGDGWLSAIRGFDTGAEVRDCPECGGMGHHHSDATVGNSTFSTVYLRLLSKLPGTRICPNADKGAHFIFDGGEGLLMPRRAA